MSYTVGPVTREGVRQIGIISSGGGGHVAVYNVINKRQYESYFGGKAITSDSDQTKELAARFPQPKDMMKDYIGKKFGNWSMHQWNNANKKGNVKKMQKLYEKRSFIELIFFLPIFINTLKELIGGDRPTAKILNTQAMGLKAVLLAVNVYNRFMKKKDPHWEDAKVELWMSDFAEKGAVPFFSPMKGLSKSVRKNLILVAPKPRGDQPIKFLMDESHLPADQIHMLEVKDLPIDPVYTSDEVKQGGPGKAVNLKLSLTANQKHDELLYSVPHLKNHIINKTSHFIKTTSNPIETVTFTQHIMIFNRGIKYTL